MGEVYSIYHRHNRNFSRTVYEWSYHSASSATSLAASSNKKSLLAVVGVPNLGQIARWLTALAVDVLAYRMKLSVIYID